MRITHDIRIEIDRDDRLQTDRCGTIKSEVFIQVFIQKLNNHFRLITLNEIVGWKKFNTFVSKL